MDDGIVLLVTGLALFASLMLLLFVFAQLREREHTRSLSVPPAIGTNATTESAVKPRNLGTADPSPYSTRIGEHYVTGGEDVVPRPGPSPAPGAEGETGRVGSSGPGAPLEASDGQGLSISGFDSAGSKVYIALNHGVISARRWGVILGRDGTLSDYEIKDRDNFVSRRHLRIRWSPADRQYEVEDLASTSGTELDERRLEPFRFTTIRPGSTIRIGRLHLDIGKA
ncbi:MAG: FHA domain-containing protein [Pseudomonadota bacterium]